MKTTTKIRRDHTSLYVRTGGGVFRPLLTRYSYPVMQPAYFQTMTTPGHRDLSGLADPYAYAPDPTLFAEGEPVHARHVSQTPYARVTSADGTRKAYWWVELNDKR